MEFILFQTRVIGLLFKSRKTRQGRDTFLNNNISNYYIESLLNVRHNILIQILQEIYNKLGEVSVPMQLQLHSWKFISVEADQKYFHFVWRQLAMGQIQAVFAHSRFDDDCTMIS